MPGRRRSTSSLASRRNIPRRVLRQSAGYRAAEGDVPFRARPLCIFRDAMRVGRRFESRLSFRLVSAFESRPSIIHNRSNRNFSDRSPADTDRTSVTLSYSINEWKACVLALLHGGCNGSSLFVTRLLTSQNIAIELGKHKVSIIIHKIGLIDKKLK